MRAFAPSRELHTPHHTSPRNAHTTRLLRACTEIYSTGKANLPGSTRQRDLLTSFARMVSELLRHSDRPDVRDRLKPHLRLCHRPKEVTRDDAPALSAMVVAPAAASTVAAPSLSGGKTARKPKPIVADLFGSDWAMAPLASIPNMHLNAADTEALLATASAFLA